MRPIHTIPLASVFTFDLEKDDIRRSCLYSLRPCLEDVTGGLWYGFIFGVFSGPTEIPAYVGADKNSYRMKLFSLSERMVARLPPRVAHLSCASQ